MEFSKLVKWAPMGLALVLGGCVINGGDDEATSLTSVGDSAATTTGDPATSTTTSDETDDVAATATQGSDSSGSAEVTTDGGNMTADSTDEGGESSSSGGAAECNVAVMLQFPNPACGPCAEASCCGALQACFGDESVMEETACLTLNNCIAENCQGAASLAELEACVDESCSENAAELEVWLGYQSCLGMNCMAECS